MGNNPTAFGIPAAARGAKRLVPYRVSTGRKEPTRDGKKTKPVALDFFLVGKPGEVDQQGNMKPLPQFTDQPKSIEIELISDDIRDMWRDELACYDGKRKFCGNDQGGNQALRRDAKGAYAPVECDPSRCALRMNDVVRPPQDGLTAYQQEIKEAYAKAYPFAALDIQTKCKAQSWFLFRLIDPQTGQPLPGEFARYHTQSGNINSQILSELASIYQDMGGRMRGLRCRLVIGLVDNGFGGKVPTVGLQRPDAAAMPKALALMARARGVQGIDFDRAMAELAKLDQTELGKLDADYIFEHFTTAEQPALMGRTEEMLALPGPVERRVIEFATNHPLANALIKKLKVDAATIGKLQQKFQDDADSLIEYLVGQCEKNNIAVAGLLQRHNWATDAEFVEVKPETVSTPPVNDEQLMAAVSGKAMHDREDANSGDSSLFGGGK